MAIDTASSRRSARSVVWGSMSPLLESIREIAVGGAQSHAVQRRARHRSCQKLAADRRQHRVRQNGVDHTPAAFHLGAAADDQLHSIFVVIERNLVMFDD